MSRDPLPEPWRSVLEPKGIHSKRGLASKVGISPQTAKRLIDGEGQPSHETVAAVADELFDGDRTRVWALAGIAREDHGDWTIPASLTSQLDPEQRKAVLAVVRAMLPPEQRRGDGDVDRDAAPMTPTKTSGPVIYMSAGSGKTETLAARLIAHMTSEQYDAVVVTLTDRVKKAGADLSVDEVRSIFDEIASEAQLDPGIYEDLAARPTTE